jgi:hypothetical protein
MPDDANDQGGRVVVSRNAPRIDPPSEITLDSEREHNFRRFKSRWDSFYILSRLSDETQEYQRALLLYTMGDEAARVVESSEKYKTDKSLVAILNVLEQYCIGESNIVHERYKFNTRNQLPTESFDTFYAELRALAGKCAFDYRPKADGGTAPADEMLRDRIVLGIRDDSVRKKLITQGNALTLEDAVRVCRSNEVTSHVMKSVAKGAVSSGTSVDAVQMKRKGTKSKPSYADKPSDKNFKPASQSKRPASGTKQPSNKCGRCGKEPHSKKDCPARDAKCRNCSRVGHYAAL